MKIRRFFAWLLACYLITSVAYAATGKQWIKDAYYKSFQAEAIQKYNDAIRALAPVLETYPNAYTVHLRLGWLYYLMGNYANSVSHYTTVIKIAPGAIEAKIGLMLPHLAQENYKDAELLANQILNFDPYNYTANYRLLLALKGQQKTDLAFIVARKMLALYPTDVGFLVELARLYDQTNDKGNAKSVYWNVLTLDPNNVSANQYLYPKQ